MDTVRLEAIAKTRLDYVEYFEFASKLGKGKVDEAKEVLLKAVDRDVSCFRMSALDGMAIYNELDLSPGRAAKFPQQALLRGPAL